MTSMATQRDDGFPPGQQPPRTTMVSWQFICELWALSCWDGENAWLVGPFPSQSAAHTARNIIRASNSGIAQVEIIPLQIEPFRPDDFQPPDADSPWGKPPAKAIDGQPDGPRPEDPPAVRDFLAGGG